MSRSGRFAPFRTHLAAGIVFAAMLPSAAPVAAQEPDNQGPAAPVAAQGPAAQGPAAQEPAAQVLTPTPNQSEEQESQQQNLDALTQQQRSEIADALGALGSNEFAERERAASRLLQVGLPILADLRRVAKDSSDPEIRLRAQQLVKQLTRGDMEARIAEFMKGAEVSFEGWRVARGVLGDSIGIRELFIELMKAHPDVLASLEGTPRDRAMAMDSTVNRIQTAMFIERRFPTRADAFALLLPAIFPDVELNAPFENLLISVLQKEAASKLRRDAHLSRPFDGLLGRWIRRSTLTNRDNVLLLGMRWDLDDTLTLAVQTLGESNQTETLGIALQAIARFGTPDHSELVRPLLDDERLATERGYTPSELVRTQLGDVAMATIAVLHKVPLTEVGFQNASEHRTFGFILTEVGFPVVDETPRKAARAKIDKLLKDTSTVEGS
jgi:hypothetical protein